jgi:signal transduction histidine kinase
MAEFSFGSWVRARGPAYIGAVIAVVVASLATAAMHRWVTPTLSLLFFPAVIVPAMYGGYGPALLSTVLSTASLAYFFVPPIYSFYIPFDDVIRLTVFASVACGIAWMSAARKQAEEALRHSLRELETVVTTLHRVSGWPLIIGPDIGVSLRLTLEHAAGIVGAGATAVVWQTEDEPWVYMASTTEPGVVTRETASTLGGWQGGTVPPELARRLGDRRPVTAPFRTEQLAGRAFFTGINVTAGDVMPVVTLVTHEIGNSLAQVYLTNRVRQLAIREDRIRVSRDLHDGVLQALTGIRFELHSIAADGSPAADRLQAIERALAIEQRELRLFINDLKPDAGGLAPSGPIAKCLEELRTTFAEEWKIPIALRVKPADLTLPPRVEHAVRLMIHEAVSNALKHARSSQVSIDVEATASDLRIVVADNGHGFAFRGRLEHKELVRTNAGPVSLRDRVASLDGRLAVESMPTGSRVELVIPVGGSQVLSRS